LFKAFMIDGFVLYSGDSHIFEPVAGPGRGLEVSLSRRGPVGIAGVLLSNAAGFEDSLGALGN
jgi:hypothetical protein